MNGPDDDLPDDYGDEDDEDLYDWRWQKRSDLVGPLNFGDDDE